MTHWIKIRISILLSALLLLGMLLTMVVTVIFWQRDLVRSHADELIAVVLRLQPSGGAQSREGEGWRRQIRRELALLLSEQDCAWVRADDRGDLLILGNTQACSNSLIRSQYGQSQQRVSVNVSGFTLLGPIPSRQFVDLAIPLSASSNQGHQYGVVYIQSSLRPVHDQILYYLPYLYAVLLVNGLVLGLVGFLRIYALLFRPLEQLVAEANSYSDDRGVPFLALNGRDEIEQLSESISHMLQRVRSDHAALTKSLKQLEEANSELISSRDEIIRAEKLSSIGRLASGIAHEIGNPIGIVQGYVDLLEQGCFSQEESGECLRRMQQELERIAALIRKLLDLTRVEECHLEVVAMDELIEGVVSLIGPQAIMRFIDISISVETKQLTVMVDASQVQQVLLNLLFNAADAIQGSEPTGKGCILIKMTEVQRDGKASLQVDVEDSGPGFKPHDLANALDPFYTTKEPGKGTGLGLSISYSLLKGMGGSIELANRDAGGGKVSICLPLAGTG